MEKRQRVSFTPLLQSLGQTSFDEIEVAMVEREEVEPEDGLSSEVLERVRERIANAHR